MHDKTTAWRADREPRYTSEVAKTKMGRPRRSAKVADELVALRLTKAERRDWERSAKAAGLTLSDWIRARCNAGVAP